MAQDKELVKSKLTVFVQDGSTDTFDASLAFAIAIAQSYSLDESGDTQEVIDLAACDSDWANPEVNKKNWTLQADSLLLRDNVASGSIDIYDKYNPYPINIGDITWVVLGDASCGAPYNPVSDNLNYRYGKAVVTSVSQTGNTDDFHTLSVTFTGKGALSFSA